MTLSTWPQPLASSSTTVEDCEITVSKCWEKINVNIELYIREKSLQYIPSERKRNKVLEGRSEKYEEIDKKNDKHVGNCKLMTV